MAQKFSGKLKFSKDSVFSIIGVFAAFILGAFAIYSATFLVSHINEALNTDVRASDAPSFDIEGFEKLNLIGK